MAAAARQKNPSRKMPMKSRRGPQRVGMHRSRVWLVAGSIGAAALMVGVGVASFLLMGFDVPGVVASVNPVHESTGTTWQAVVTADAVNVRAGASTGSDVIDSAAAGQQVTVTGSSDGIFLPVTIDGRQGWIATDYLSRATIEPDRADHPGQFASTAHGVALEPPAPAVGEILVAMSNDVPGEAPTDVAVPVRVPGETDRAAQTDVPVPTEAPMIVDPTGAPTVVADADSGADVEVASAKDGEHWIDVDRATAMVTLYAGDRPLASFPGKIGRDPSADGFYSTAVGTFHVYSMQEGLSSTPFVDDVYLSDWVGFDPVRKNGFHSPVREADGSERLTQNPTTMGCVRLNAGDAIALFDFAFVGMRVEIHDE